MCLRYLGLAYLDGRNTFKTRLDSVLATQSHFGSMALTWQDIQTHNMTSESN